MGWVWREVERVYGNLRSAKPRAVGVDWKRGRYWGVVGWSVTVNIGRVAYRIGDERLVVVMVCVAPRETDHGSVGITYPWDRSTSQSMSFRLPLV